MNIDCSPSKKQRPPRFKCQQATDPSRRSNVSGIWGTGRRAIHCALIVSDSEQIELIANIHRSQQAAIRVDGSAVPRRHRNLTCCTTRPRYVSPSLRATLGHSV